MSMHEDGRVRLRLSTAEEWASVNPILDDGEPGLVRSGSVVLMKIGDGVTAWNDLGYLGINPLDIYPVGSIYTSTVDVSPATLFGGTWEKMPAGRVLVAEGTYTENGKTFNFTAGSTGGEAEHQLTIGELAEHKHRLMSDSSTTTATTDTVYALTDHKVELTAIGANYRDLDMIDYAGSSNPHNNLQPFTSVYIFKRVL